ncbi:GNAT family N-acetyltransferase [Bradyrhizobium sp. DOA9]|uniref:GNAT family N-acetyltransferase n=1 Tax=Bradyrhizobium sp. DOA9 TaxID=1126627 RepID=UPI00046848BD|nr:GNAT family N-acetyltransferase [Bradyrhizobium sp. DOA9]GAJ37533.1 hypothetical protein BDOA9_0201500 [Bradyrhizobium sp. DOA9]
MNVLISESTLDEIVPLRYRLMRPDHIGPDAPFEFKLTSADMSDISIHLIAHTAERVVGIISAGPEPCPFRSCEESWRLRGFAVDRSIRRHGIGSALLSTIMLRSQQRGAIALWANPRVGGALDLVMKFGFETVDGQYQVPAFGPHQNVVLTF